LPRPRDLFLYEPEAAEGPGLGIELGRQAVSQHRPLGGERLPRRNALRDVFRICAHASSIPQLTREAVALAVDGQDMTRALGIVLELLPEAQDVGVHGPRGGELLVAPDLVEQPVSRDDLVAVLDQIAQQIELLASQAHFLAPAEDLPASQPDPHISERELLELLPRPWPPQHPANPRHELA